MQSNSKRLKEDNDNLQSTNALLASDANEAPSQLPSDLYHLLKNGLQNGFVNGYLSLYYKGIDDSMMPEICSWIAKFEGKLKTLVYVVLFSFLFIEITLSKKIWDRLSGNRVSAEMMSMFFDRLRDINTQIENIWLNNCRLDDQFMKSLGLLIKANTSIENINVGTNMITDKGIEILGQYINSSTTLRSLSLQGNKGIIDKSVPILIKMIESSRLESVNIDDTSITQKRLLIVPLTHNVLKYGANKLNLEEKEVNDDYISKICEEFEKYGLEKLNEISLKRNSLTSVGATLLFERLRKSNSLLIELNLFENQLDDECMKSLGEYIQDNDYLETLGLGNNCITDKGVEILSLYLVGNIQMKEIFLGNRALTDASIPHLVEVAKRSCITRINIFTTSISSEKHKELNDLLDVPIDEREVPIKSFTKSAAKVD